MNPLQKASVRRKVIYVGCILAIFTLSIAYRGQVAKAASGAEYVWVPFGRDDRRPEDAPTALNRAADWVARNTIRSQAHRAELREVEQGDPEVAGSTLRLSLVGFRGMVLTMLWNQAIDKQKRNDFHEFEFLVRIITKLQPNFATPWQFQSWNIAYNVSVEQDRLNDMYFYIARGIDLLAEGERRIKRSPDLRYTIGFYYQNKFGVSDKVQTLRCLFQLSCIPPTERIPPTNRTFEEANPFLQADGSVNPEAFLEFVRKHPHLARRLRDKLNLRTPMDVVQFLFDNRKVPTRFVAGSSELADPADQFPALPPAFDEGPNEAHPGKPLGDDFSGFGAARAWFSYSCVDLPPNPVHEQGWALPSGTPRPGTGPDEYDPTVYRVPRQPMLIIFRQGPPRAQSFVAELEQKEGWFDNTGWRVDQNADPSTAWFPGRDEVVGTDKAWSLAAWEDAYNMWRRHADAYGLYLSPDRLETLREESRAYPGEFRVGFEPSPEQKADPDFMRAFRARRALFYYTQNRSVTNFPYHRAQAEAEQKPETVQARKTLWQADQARRLYEQEKAAALYRDGLTQWRKVLAANPNFHRGERSEFTEEWTYEQELEYLRLVTQVSPEVKDRAAAVANGLHAAIAFLPDPKFANAPNRPKVGGDELTWAVAAKFFSPLGEPMNALGDPWVREDIKRLVLERDAGIRKGTGQQAAATPTTPATAGP